MTDIYRAHLAPLQELAARILETKNLDDKPDALARELLAAFHEVAQRHGLDGPLADLQLLDDPQGDSRPELQAALSTRLATKTEFDARGPRNAKPKQLADCVVNALGLTVVDDPTDRTTLAGEVRRDATAAIAAVIDVAFEPATIRAAIIEHARSRIDERHFVPFKKLAAELDERGMRLVNTPKVPLDAVQAFQQVAFDARAAVIGAACSTAIDRAKAIVAAADPVAAERIDQPITRTATPRDVAIRRVVEPRASKQAADVTRSLITSLSELARITWRTVEKTARPYAASQSFAVGELITHPKFGTGTVVSVDTKRIDVEFPEGKNTLVHVKK